MNNTTQRIRGGLHGKYGPRATKKRNAMHGNAMHGNAMHGNAMHGNAAMHIDDDTVKMHGNADQIEMGGGAIQIPPEHLAEARIRYKENYKQRFGITAAFATELTSYIKTNYSTASAPEITKALKVINNLTFTDSPYYGPVYKITDLPTFVGKGNAHLKTHPTPAPTSTIAPTTSAPTSTTATTPFAAFDKASDIEKMVFFILTDSLDKFNTYIKYFTPQGPVVNPSLVFLDTILLRNLLNNKKTKSLNGGDYTMDTMFFQIRSYTEYFKEGMGITNFADENGFPLLDETGKQVSTYNFKPTKSTGVAPMVSSSTAPGTAAIVGTKIDIDKIPIGYVLQNSLNVNNEWYSLFGIKLVDNQTSYDYDPANMFLYCMNDPSNMYRFLNSSILMPPKQPNVYYLSVIVGKIEQYLSTKSKIDPTNVKLISTCDMEGIKEIATGISDDPGNPDTIGSFIKTYIEQVNQKRTQKMKYYTFDYTDLAAATAAATAAAATAATAAATAATAAAPSTTTPSSTTPSSAAPVAPVSASITVLFTKITATEVPNLDSHDYENDVKKFIENIDLTNPSHFAALQQLMDDGQLDENICLFLNKLAGIIQICNAASGAKPNFIPYILSTGGVGNALVTLANATAQKFLSILRAVTPGAGATATATVSVPPTLATPTKTVMQGIISFFSSYFLEDYSKI
jgi:hypothetical protein